MPATDRRIATGRPSPLSAIALPAPPAAAPHRQTARSRDTHSRQAVLEAEATIDHFLDADPERIARLMMNWINDGDDTTDQPA